MENITRTSRILYRLFWALFYALPVLTAAFWAFADSLPLSLLQSFLPIYHINPEFTGFKVKVLAFVISLLPISVAMYGTKQFINFFECCMQAEIFTRSNVKLFKRVGTALVVWVVATWIFDVFISLLLSSHNFTLEPSVEVVLSHSDVITVLCASIIFLIGWIFDEALKLSEESEFTV